MELKRTFDFLEYALENHPLNNALNIKRNDKWEPYSTKELKHKADLFSSGLIELGIKKGDKILSVSNNRPEWHIADTGMSQIGAVHVPIYPTLNANNFKKLFLHSEAKLLIISSADKYETIKPILKEISSIKYILTFDKIKNAENFDSLIDSGNLNFDKNKGKIQQIKASISENELSSIIYTSGTTGEPKGVMLTHKNIVSNVIESSVSATPDIKRAISFLPLNHVFERMVNYLYFYQGVEVYFTDRDESLVEDIQDVKPHVFATVPRLLEKIYDKIYLKGLELKGVKKGIFFSSLRSAQKYNYKKNQNIFQKTKLALDNKLVFSKWREALGGEIKMIISSGAALQPRLTRVFGAAKIPIVEGYGLTETSPTISVNRPNDIRPGTVGRLLESSKVKISKHGEILFKGPGLMMGYYKDLEKTEEAIDEDGWFHTGDMGLLNGDVLKITGRTKELFKLSTGEYVAPQLVENIMKESPFIEFIMVIGEGKRFCSAIICPNFEHLQNWALKHDIQISSKKNLIENKEVLKKFNEEIEELNFDIEKEMIIKKIYLVKDEWAPDTGELTPTLKLKRSFIFEKYSSEIDSLFS